MLGHLDQVEVALRKALDLSDRLDHKASLSQTHMFCAETFMILNRMEEAEAHLNICVPLAEKYSLANYLIPAKIMQGLVRTCCEAKSKTVSGKLRLLSRP